MIWQHDKTVLIDINIFMHIILGNISQLMRNLILARLNMTLELLIN